MGTFAAYPRTQSLILKQNKHLASYTSYWGIGHKLATVGYLTNMLQWTLYR